MKVLNLTVEEKPFLMQQIEALEEEGVESDIVTVPGNRVIDEENIQRHSFLDYAKFYPKVLRRSIDSYDLVHAHFGLTAPFALAQPRRPVVTSLWGWDLNGEYGRVSKRCASLSDAVLVRNQEMADMLDRDAHVVERGVDFEKFAPRDQLEAQCEVGWDSDKYHVLFPYSPSRDKKNHPLAKEIVNSVNEQIAETVELEEVYNKPHHQIPTYMNASDALLMTSESEGSPNTVKEALACNLPVVSTDVGDVGDLIPDSSLSAVCADSEELCNALVRVLSSGQSESHGRDSIQSLTWRNTAKTILDIYEPLI